MGWIYSIPNNSDDVQVLFSDGTTGKAFQVNSWLRGTEWVIREPENKHKRVVAYKEILNQQPSNHGKH